MAPKVFIVTGASKGIGLAVAQYLLKQSHKLVLAARSEDLLQSVKQSHPGQVEYEAGDLTNPELPGKLVQLAIKSFGQLDGIVINHGVLNAKKLASSSLEEVKYVYDVNVFSYLAMAQAGLEELRKSKGSIVWVSSGAGTAPYKGWGAYCSTKAAMNSIAGVVALEEPEITSIAVTPGRVDTEMQGALRADGKDIMDKAQYDSFVEQFQQGTLLRPEQPGNVIAKLAEEPPKHLSGKLIKWDSPELAAYHE